MSLAAVLYPSPTQQGWKEWSFHNFTHHQAIEIGLRQVRNIKPNPFRLWPVSEHDFQDWLEQHQQAHNFFNAALGLSGQDLSQLDMKNKAKRDDWFFVHYLQHQAAAQVLGLSIL